MLRHEQIQVVFIFDLNRRVGGQTGQVDLDAAGVCPVLGVLLANFEDGGEAEVGAGGDDLGS